MKTRPLASPHDDVEKAFPPLSPFCRRSAFLFAALLVLALPVEIAAQTNTNAPVIVVQPQSQSVFGGTSVTLSVAAGQGGTLPAIGSGTLQLWLRADAGVITNNGGQIIQWDDQSGNGNNAGQANTNLQPSLIADTGLGGQPAVRFNGIQDGVHGSYMNGTELVSIPNAMTVFTVYNALSTANNEMLWDLGVPGQTGASRGGMITGGDLHFTIWNYDYIVPIPVPTNTYRIRTDSLDASLETLNIFDITMASTTNVTVSVTAGVTPGAGYYLGGLNPSLPGVGESRNLNFNGDIAEIIVYKGALSGSDGLAVVNYLEQKFYQFNGTSLNFQWLFNGTNLAGATNSSLTFTNVQSAQAGTYSVVVSNAYGSVTSSNAVLEVNLIPIILAQPANQTAFFNQTITFNVQAEGPVPLQYQWTFAGTNITGATNSALVLSNVVASDAGTYAVVLGMEPNVTVSSNAVLGLSQANEVVSNLDAGELNLALQAGGTVAFNVSGTIVLTNTISLSNSVILDGTNQSITISGGSNVEIFNILPAGQITLRNLTLANGVDNATAYNDTCFCQQPAPSYGGAIFTLGTLDIDNCMFTNNHAPGGGPIEQPATSGSGGAIYNTGWLTITNTVFANNSAIGGNSAGPTRNSETSSMAGADGAERFITTAGRLCSEM